MGGITAPILCEQNIADANLSCLDLIYETWNARTPAASDAN